MKPGDRVKIRGMGFGKIAEIDPVDAEMMPNAVPVETDDGAAGYVPREWIKVIEP